MLIKPGVFCSTAVLEQARAATAEKGKQLMELVVERFSSFLVELAASKMDERFPY